MSEDSVNSGRKNGRPVKGDAPRVPYEELDRILVFGEVVTCEDGESTTVQYPSYRDLARRYGVCNSVIARYSKKHNCLRRREQATARIAVETDKKLVDLRATAIAMSSTRRRSTIGSDARFTNIAVRVNTPAFSNAERKK